MQDHRRDRTAKLAAWRQRLGTAQFTVPRDKGVLWTGISSATAAALARHRHLVTLEMTPVGRSLDCGTMKRELDLDFGPSWIAEKREVFKVASQRFAESLSGTLTLFLPAGLTRPRNGAPGSFAYAVKILWDELRTDDFGDPRVVAHRTTSIRICRVEGERIVDEKLLTQAHTSPYLH